MWLLSLNYTYRGMKGTFQPCHPNLKGPPQGSQTGTSPPTPEKLKQNSGINKHSSTPDPNVHFLYGSVPLCFPSLQSDLELPTEKDNQVICCCAKRVGITQNLIFLYISHQNPMRVTVQKFPSISPFTGAYGKHNIIVQWPWWFKGTTLCFSVDSRGGHSNSTSLEFLLYPMSGKLLK